MKTIVKLSGVISVLLIIAGCNQTPQTPLYERFGGKPAISAVVNDFVDLVGQDRRVIHQVAPERVPWVKDRLVEQLCQGSGGPCTYTGRDMKTTHTDMGISNAEFDAVIDDLVKTLDKYKVGEREKHDVLALLEPMRKDIVEVQ